MSRIAIPLTVVICCAGCILFPRWVYVAETRVELLADSESFSASDLSRAKLVDAEVASEIGMKPQDETPNDLEIERKLSGMKTPPRQYVITYTGKMSQGLPIELRVETSEDGRALYFSISDPERGSGRPVVTRIRKLMMSNVEAAFPDASIVHEAWTSGPFFDHP